MGQGVFFEMEQIAEDHLPHCGGFPWCNVSLPLEERAWPKLGPAGHEGF